MSRPKDVKFVSSKPKTTSIGDGKHSRPKKRGAKKYRGQGR